MAGGKLNARQKMINLMYLVFIAMMALNIDREVLRSFADVNESLQNTNSLSKSNNSAFVDAIVKTAETDEKYREAAENSRRVSSEIKPILAFIDELKSKLVGKEVKVDKEGNLNYSVLSNQESVTKLFFVNDTKTKPEADELVNKIKAFNELLKSIQEETKGSEKPINTGNYIIDISDVPVKGGKKQTWIHQTFYGQPQVAAETTLTNLQNKILNAETQIISQYLSKKVLESVEINAFKGIISSPGFIKQGENATTYAALGAFDNRINGTAVINGRPVSMSDGKATIPLETGSLGTKTLSGYMTFTDGKGKEQRVEFEPVTYEVVKAVFNSNEFSAAVSADKMNVFYIGLDNPITASVTGVESNSISISGPGVSNKGGGKATVRPSSPGTMNVTVSGKTKEGQTLSKSFPFRVKSIPAPEGRIRGKNTLILPASSVGKQVVSVDWPDFLYDIRANVTGFSVKVPGLPSRTFSGSNLSSANDMFQNLRPNDVVSVFAIKSNFNGTPIKEAATITIEIR